MGVGVSGWQLARKVSAAGQLGVVSGTALDHIFSRRLQDGDVGGHIRRALGHFPFPKMAERLLRRHFRPGGRRPGEPYRIAAMHAIPACRDAQELCMAANFVEVFLAREGHDRPVGINYLEKISLPHLPSLYGAMLAGVAVVIVGAGIPMEIPAALEALAAHQPAKYGIRVAGKREEHPQPVTFDPREFMERPVALRKPAFLPIVSSASLASILKRRLDGGMDGVVVEGHVAGGHNSPPRGPLTLSASGEPVYGPRDELDLNALRALDLPFWLAGACGTPEKLRAALAAGAAGIQVGTAFALCVESGFKPEIRRQLVLQALDGQAHVFTDPVASPAGYPFKVADFGGSLSEQANYDERRRICDLGLLREAYRRPDGSIGYRCPAEPQHTYVAKGGSAADAVSRKCLCNALLASIGLAQALPDGGSERCLITLGDDLSHIGLFCTAEHPDFSATDVIRVLLG